MPHFEKILDLEKRAIALTAARDEALKKAGKPPERTKSAWSYRKDAARFELEACEVNFKRRGTLEDAKKLAASALRMEEFGPLYPGKRVEIIESRLAKTEFGAKVFEHARVVLTELGRKGPLSARYGLLGREAAFRNNATEQNAYFLAAAEVMAELWGAVKREEEGKHMKSLTAHEEFVTSALNGGIVGMEGFKNLPLWRKLGLVVRECTSHEMGILQRGLRFKKRLAEVVVEQEAKAREARLTEQISLLNGVPGPEMQSSA